MNVEQLLANPLVETFAIDGAAPTLEGAHDAAWLALSNAHRDVEDITSWLLKVMQHTSHNGGVQFHAEFVRRPDELA